MSPVVVTWSVETVLCIGLMQVIAFRENKFQLPVPFWSRRMIWNTSIHLVSWPISEKAKGPRFQTIYNELSYTINCTSYNFIFHHILRHRKDVLSALLMVPPPPPPPNKAHVTSLQWRKTLMPSASTSLCKLDQSIEFGYSFRWKFGTPTPNLSEILRHIIARWR